MSDRSVLIAESIRHSPSWYAMDIWMQQEFRRLDLGQILIYFIEKVNADVLPILAQEFDLLGNKGFNFCVDELAQRALLNKAAQFHRYRGTVWAIEQCLELVGITSGTVVENMGMVGDGCDWARFSVVIDTSIMNPTSIQKDNAEKLINIYKNARSEFLGYTII